MSIDKTIVKDFVNESKNLIQESMKLLEKIEGDFSQVQELARYGNTIDRIMGAAKSLASVAPEAHAIHMIASYTAICKVVGYKASQIQDNAQFYDVCVGFLLDATETLAAMVNRIDDSAELLKAILPDTFIDRVRWISKQFNNNYADSVAAPNKGPSLNQNDIDLLMKKLGL